MTSFLSKVKTATASLGKAPYNDRKTLLDVAEATKRVKEDYERFTHKK